MKFFNWYYFCTFYSDILHIKQAVTIERVQRVAVSIILSDCTTGQSDYSFDGALAKIDIEPLENRRVKLCNTIAHKILKSRHANIFKTNKTQHYTRSKPGFVTNMSNTKRFYNSPINYLTRLLNSDSWTNQPSSAVVWPIVIIGQWMHSCAFSFVHFRWA